MTVEVRSARAADHAAWRAMRRGLWPDAGLDEHEAEMNAIAQRDDLVCVLALAAAEPVGFAEASVRRDPVNGCDTSPVGFLEGIYVRPDHRRSGTARALLAAVERWAVGQGCAELGSDTEADNAGGQAFHLGTGFEERERVVVYRRRLG